LPAIYAQPLEKVKKAKKPVVVTIKVKEQVIFAYFFRGFSVFEE